jgi:hypothetical protein
MHDELERMTGGFCDLFHREDAFEEHDRLRNPSGAQGYTFLDARNSEGVGRIER